MEIKKKIVFVTGTRADFGKLRPLIDVINNSNDFEYHIFVTGMHTLSTYGSTYREIEKRGYKNIFIFMNQTDTIKQDIILSNTIIGLSNYINELSPDMIIIHGDRLEALAGLNAILAFVIVLSVISAEAIVPSAIIPPTIFVIGILRPS